MTFLGIIQFLKKIRQNESSEEEGEKENSSDNWNSNIEIIPGIVNPQV